MLELAIRAVQRFAQAVDLWRGRRRRAQVLELAVDREPLVAFRER